MSVTKRDEDWIEHARLADIEDVARRLGLRLPRRSGELVGPCPRCGGEDRFVISPRKQVFRCRKCRVAGDAIALAAHVEGLDVHRHDDFLQAVGIVTGKLRTDAAPEPEREIRLAERERHRVEREAEQREHARRSRDWAMGIWREGKPAAGTLVERYLGARAIAVELPPTLRFHPELPHWPSGTAWPAMVGLVTRDRAAVGVHRTWLARDGSGKAPVDRPKMMLGPCGGGAVRLGPVAEHILVTEGIETALTVMEATGTPTWAALGTSGLVSLALPPEVRDVVICADRDPDGAGKHAASASAQRWRAEDRRVRIAVPPPGFSDFNDVATEHAP